MYPAHLAIFFLLVGFNARASLLEDTHAHITIENGYQFQGIDQSQGDASINMGVEYQITDELSAGAWLGEFTLPANHGDSTEIDYFISYRKPLSFAHNIHTSIWRYTYRDKDLKPYDWSQWIVGYDWNNQFGLTLGLSNNYLRGNRTTTFTEATYRHGVGHVMTSLSIGRHDLSAVGLENFGYLHLKGVYSWENWRVFANYTRPESLKGFTKRFAADGWGVGVSYTL